MAPGMVGLGVAGVPGTMKPEKKRRPKKDPDAPKKPMAAYMFFSSDFRDKVKAQHPNASFGELGRMLGDMWKAMDERQKAPYEKKAVADKERYQAEKKVWDLRPKPQVVRGTGKRSKKDPNAPKKPMGAYMFFCAANREQLKANNPNASFGEIGRMLGDMWKGIDERNRVPYEKKAEADKARYEKEKKAYEAILPPMMPQHYAAAQYAAPPMHHYQQQQYASFQGGMGYPPQPGFPGGMGWVPGMGYP